MTTKQLLRNLIYLFFLVNSVAFGEESFRPIINLHHLSLKMTEDLWEQKNLNIQIAKTQVEAAKADTLSAARRPNPQLSYYMNSIGTGRDHRYLNGSDQVIHIDQTFERGDKRELRIKNADLMLHASESDLQNIARLSKTQLYQLYYQLLLAQEKLRISEDNVSLYQKTLEVSQLRFKAGDISSAELSRLDLDKLRAENEVLQAKNNLKQAQIELAMYIGEELNAPVIEASDTWPKLMEKAYQNSINVDDRPDVKAAMLRLNAADTNLELALALKKRDITIGAQIEHNSLDLESNTVGLGVSIPLLTGYGYEGEIARAASDKKLAETDLERIKAQAISEINRARGDLKTAEARVMQYDENLLKEADKVLQSAEFAYQQGAQSVMDLLDARRTYKLTQIEAMNARYEYATSLSSWLLLSQESKTQ